MRPSGIFLLLPAAALCLWLAACSTTTLSSSWRDPQYQGGPMKKVLVIGMSDQDAVRRSFEDRLASSLSKFGADADAGYNLFTGDELKDRDRVETEVRSRGYDKVLITRLVKTRTEQVTQPGYVRGYPYGSAGYPYRGWYDHYAYSSGLVYQPPTTYQFEIATIESSLYDAATGKPVWSAVLETELGDKLDATIDSFVEVVVEDLKKQGML